MDVEDVRQRRRRLPDRPGLRQDLQLSDPDEKEALAVARRRACEHGREDDGPEGRGADACPGQKNALMASLRQFAVDLLERVGGTNRFFQEPAIGWPGTLVCGGVVAGNIKDVEVRAHELGLPKCRANLWPAL